MAGVAAGVKVVGGLLEEHELECLGAFEGLLGAVVVVGLECVGSGSERRASGDTSGGGCGYGHSRCGGGDGLLQPTEVQAFAAPDGSGAPLGEQADAGKHVLQQARRVGVLQVRLSGGRVRLACGGQVAKSVLLVQPVSRKGGRGRP